MKIGKKAFFSVGLASLLGTSVTFAAPVTIDFEAMAGTASYIDGHHPFSEDGFDFDFEFIELGEGSQAGFYAIGDENFCVSLCTTNGTSVFYHFAAGTLQMSRGGGLFSLLSLDATSAFPFNPLGTFVRAIGTLDDGETVGTIFSSPDSDNAVFKHFLFPSAFTNLVSVAFTGDIEFYGDGTTQYAIDNIVANPGLREVEATPVPEPASAALLSMGLLAFGFARARKNKSGS